MDLSTQLLLFSCKQELEADQARENSGRASQVTDQEAKKLRQEILQQEILIRGYQVHFWWPSALKFLIHLLLRRYFPKSAFSLL